MAIIRSVVGTAIPCLEQRASHLAELLRTPHRNPAPRPLAQITDQGQQPAGLRMLVGAGEQFSQCDAGGREKVPATKYG